MMTSVQPTNNPVPSDNPADARDNFKRIDEIVNLQAGQTNPTRTGKELETLYGLNQRYLLAIQQAGGIPLNGGVWAAGQTYTSYNQYMIFNGVPYRPLTTTTLPYGPTGSAPDGAFVGPYTSVTSQILGGLTNYQASSVADMIAGTTLNNSTIEHVVGQVWSIYGSWRVVSVSSPMTINDFEAIGPVFARDFGSNSSLVQDADDYAAANSLELKLTGVFDLTSLVTFSARLVDSFSQHFTATSMVSIANGFVRPDWWGDIEESVVKAIDALPTFGGVVKLDNKRYKINNTNRTVDFVSKQNVTIEGAAMPRVSDNARTLEGGSVIEGRFNVFADGFTAKNVGFDFGEDVRAEYYPTYNTETSNHPNGGDWSALAFGPNDTITPARLRKNVHFENVIGLCSRPLTSGHAILIEGIDGLTYDNVTGIFSLHAFVLKAENVRAGAGAGYAASEDNFLIKSNSFAPSNDIQISSITAKKDIPLISSPWIAPQDSTYGFFVNPDDASISGIQIGTLRTDGGQRGYLIRGQATQTAKDISIGSAFITNATTLGIGADTCEFYEIQIGNLIMDTVGVGMAYNLTNSTFASWPPVKIDSAQCIAVSNWAVQASGFANIQIDLLNIKVAGYAYYNETNARILVGKEKFSNVAAKWYVTGLEPGPALSPSYQDATGFRPHEIRLENYGVVIDGAFDYVGGGTPTENVTLLTLPSYLRTPTTMLMNGTTKDGTNYSGNGLGLTSGGSVTYNEGNSAPPASAVVTCNISWNHF